jgi:branched-subunit amino acid ABC-type transport system permease component
MAEHDMGFEEKIAWAGVIVSIVHFTIYLGVLLTRAATTPMPETPYVDAMLWSIGAAIVVMIVVSIIVGVTTGKDGHETDIRDKQIKARAEFTSRGLLIAAALAALIFAMLELDPFWIANVLYLGFFLSAMLETVTKIALYRGGVPAW